MNTDAKVISASLAKAVHTRSNICREGRETEDRFEAKADKLVWIAHLDDWPDFVNKNWLEYNGSSDVVVDYGQLELFYRDDRTRFWVAGRR